MLWTTLLRTQMRSALQPALWRLLAMLPAAALASPSAAITQSSAGNGRRQVAQVWSHMMMGMTARAGALLLQQQPFYGLAPSRVVIGQPVLQPMGAPSALRSLPVNVPMARAVSAPARPTKQMKMPLDDVKLVMAVTNASGQLERLGHRPSGPICAAESGAAALRHLASSMTPPSRRSPAPTWGRPWL